MFIEIITMIEDIGSNMKQDQKLSLAYTKAFKTSIYPK